MNTPTAILNGFSVLNFKTLNSFDVANFVYLPVCALLLAASLLLRSLVALRPATLLRGSTH